jgi:hypothetical protein
MATISTPKSSADGAAPGQTSAERQARHQAKAQFDLALRLDAEGRHGDAVNALRRACTGGYVPAMTFLAGRLLSGRGAPAAPADGVKLLTMAAEAGSADANTMIATLAAAGVGMAQDWTRALDHLQRAAELGAVRAQGQLRALSGLPAAGALNWAQARRSVDVARWLVAPPKRSLCDAPRVRAVEGFATPAVCDWLIARGRVLARPAMVFDAQTGGAAQADARSNTAAQFDIVQADLVTVLIQAKISATLGIPVPAMELCQVLHYEVGQEFAPHFDHLDVSVPGYAADVALRGQRIATFLLYLNDDFEGGETYFPLIDLKHRGRRGDALYFANVDAAHRPDPLTLHAGLPPTAGEKWLLSQWMRDRAGPTLSS